MRNQALGGRRRIEEMFDRIAAGESLARWSVVAAPRESLRVRPQARDVVLLRRGEQTAVMRVVRSAGERVLVEDRRGARWTQILDEGRVREDIAIAREARLAEQASTPRPVLSKDTPVTLVAASQLPALRVGLRLHVVAPRTRKLLTDVVAKVATLAGSTALPDLRAARDALDAAIRANAVPAKATRFVQLAVKEADKLLALSVRVDEVAAVAKLKDIDALAGADAMKALVDARGAVKAVLGAKVSPVITRAKEAQRKLAGTAQVTSAADLRTHATSLQALLVALAKPKTFWTPIDKHIDQKREGGGLDATHLARAMISSREVTDTTVISEWKLLGIADVLGDELMKIVRRSGVRPALTEAIKDAFGKAFRSKNSASPTATEIERCVDAVVAAFPVLADDRDKVRAAARELIVTVAGDRVSTTAASAVTRVDAAKAVRETKVFAEDLLATARKWPFEDRHFLDRTMKLFDHFAPGFDIFGLIGGHLVTYNFLGQDSITISEDLVQPLELAERHYFGIRDQFPDTNFVVEKETGAFNFRLAREKVMRKLLLHGPKGFYVHTVGRAIDINYPDDRNPHVTDPADIWMPVGAVLMHAASTATSLDEAEQLRRLAKINFTGTGEDDKSEDILFDMLEASRMFQLHHDSWVAAAPQSFVVPQTSWPKPRDYKRALETAGLTRSSKVVRDAQRAAETTAAAETKALRTLLEQAIATAKAWRKAFDALRARHRALLDDDKVSQMSSLRVAMKGLSREVMTVNDKLERFEKIIAKAKKERDRRPAFVLFAQHVVDAADAARGRLDHDARARGIDVTKADLAVARARKRWRREQEMFEGMVALLPRTATDLATAERAHGAARRATERAASDPLLEKFKAGQRDLRLITVFVGHRARYRTWARQGFTDHDPFFMWAMKRAGFTWGGEFANPDLHHFEIKQGLNWKSDW